ncbi:hypothetical protein [Intestinimonas timonensis]|nr:hypothetical protein [Intestinimonas timonensis]
MESRDSRGALVWTLQRRLKNKKPLFPKGNSGFLDGAKLEGPGSPMY